jgi:cysteinyl-tRNA synthetase
MEQSWGEGFPGWHIECSAMNLYLGTQFDIHGGGMDLMFPHHESEIAQSMICNHQIPARYWIHNNMITINGKKMGKSYNNVISLTDMFSGNSPLLTQAYHPMTIRFFILQTQYRSTLDFGNDALQAAEKGLKRLWDAYQELLKMKTDPKKTVNEQIEKQFLLCREMDDFMNDDLNTAKVLANMFQLVNYINSFRSGELEKSTLSAETLTFVQSQFKTYVEDVLGLLDETKTGTSDKLNGIMNLLIDIRREAKAKKDYQTSDRIRNQLMEIGISLKDEKDGRVSFSID